MGRFDVMGGRWHRETSKGSTPTPLVVSTSPRSSRVDRAAGRIIRWRETLCPRGRVSARTQGDPWTFHSGHGRRCSPACSPCSPSTSSCTATRTSSRLREAGIWSAIWVAIGLAVGGVIWWAYGSEFGLQYYAGYVIEKSLAVDNVFVWAVIFSYFAVPRQYQHRVLFYGVIGALIFRGIFIAARIGADRELRLGALRLRRLPHPDGHPDAEAARRAHRPLDLEDAAAVPPLRPDHGRVRRRSLPHPSQRRAHGDAAARRAGRSSR